MSGAISPLPNTPSWRGAQLKHRESFTFFIVLEKLTVIQLVKKLSNFDVAPCRDVVIYQRL
jgi:hypothetical protein